MRLVALMSLTYLSFAQETLLFDQSGQAQWSDTSVEYSGAQYRILADDFELYQQATITRIDILGTMPEERLASIGMINLRILRDTSGMPGAVVFEDVFDEPDPDKDGSFALQNMDLDLDPGKYWIAVSELFYGSDTPTPWRWNGTDQVAFGEDYVISNGEGYGPSQWAYSSDVYGTEYPPGTLFFQIFGIPAPELLDPNIPPPSFITDRDVWLDENDRIAVWCPDPNGDGAIQRETSSRGYTFRLVQDCQVLESAIATPSAYPGIFKFSSPIPEGPYTIEVSRYFEYSEYGQKRATESVPRVYAGPDAAGGDTVIATKTTEIGRWLLHLPRISGGFTGEVTFFNRFPELPAPIWVAGFDENGTLVDGTRQKLLIIGQVQSLPIYGRNGAEGLFDETIVDRVSHLGLFEPKGAALIETSLTYQSIQENALTASVDELNLIDGTFVGAGFSLDSRPATVYWDGAAVLNLTGNTALNVSVALVGTDGNVIDERQLSPVAPGSKRLLILSDLFPQSGTVDGHYMIQSDQEAPFQVLGLRGTLISTPPLLVNSKVSKVR